MSTVSRDAVACGQHVQPLEPFVDDNQGIKCMGRLYSLSYMTLETSPPKMIEFAAEAGYDLAGIRMMPTLPGGQAFPLMNDPAMLRETLLRIDDTGVKVLDVEIARIDGVSGVELWLPMLEASAKVGARTIVVAGDDPNEARMTETYGLLCDAAAPFGLTDQSRIHALDDAEQCGHDKPNRHRGRARKRRDIDRPHPCGTAPRQRLPTSARSIPPA